MIVLYNSLNDLFLCRRYKDIRKMDSTYITTYGSNGSVRQPTSQPVSLSALDRQSDFSQPVSLFVYP